MDGLKAKLVRVEAGGRVPPERLAHLEGVVEEPAAPLEVEPRRFVLLALPSHADPQVEAPTREDVEGGRRLRQHDGPAEGGEQDPCCQPHPRRDGGDHGEHGERLQPEPVGAGGLPSSLLTAELGVSVGVEILAEHDVVGDEQAVDAGVVSRPGPVEQGPPAAGVVGRVRPQHDGEAGGGGCAQRAQYAIGPTPGAPPAPDALAHRPGNR